jgi:NAD(P)-dependent dehydrogenase (short-subunit alcohol dehydrogenase family)
MLARGHGHLVNISSLAGVATFPGLAAYGATKAGLTHLTSGLRADLRGGPVGTLAVELGPVSSAMMGRISGHRPAAAAFDLGIALLAPNAHPWEIQYCVALVAILRGDDSKVILRTEIKEKEIKISNHPGIGIDWSLEPAFGKIQWQS